MNNKFGKKKYSRLVRLFRDGYISVAVYKSVHDSGKVFYDIVVYRKTKNKETGEYEYKRGVNLKPEDCLIASNLLNEAYDCIKAQGYLPTSPHV